MESMTQVFMNTINWSLGVLDPKAVLRIPWTNGAPDTIVMTAVIYQDFEIS